MYGQQYVTLLAATTAVKDGAWQYCGNWLMPFSVIVQGFNGADRAEVRVANGVAAPSTASGGIAYSTSLSADAIVKVAEAYTWVIARKTIADASPASTSAVAAALSC